MFAFRTDDASAQLAALHRSQAVIEFAPDGTILTANANFLAAMGYALDEVRGRHHEVFVDPAERKGVEYRAFWDDLRRGEAQNRFMNGVRLPAAAHGLNPKPRPTFADALAGVRCAIWRERALATSPRRRLQTKPRFRLPAPWAYALYQAA